MDATSPRLLVDPKNELVFTGPFDNIVQSSIKLTNTTSQRVCFKVKTTVPKSYCVKPSSGIVEPLGSLTVDVLLQPNVQIPTDRSKHKFMVQSLIAPNDAGVDIEQLWKEAKPGDLQDSKLKCVMRMPEEIVSISPSSLLTFEGPFTQTTSALIKITNNSDSNICFKIQITNPKMFSVSPVSGLVDSHSTLNVKVVMHPWDYDPKTKYKDRFLIQWVSSPHLSAYQDSVWTECLARNDRILKCNYSLPDNNSEFNSIAPSDGKENGEYENLTDVAKLRQENMALKENETRLRQLMKNEERKMPRPMMTAQHDQDLLTYKNVLLLLLFTLIVGIAIGYYLF